MAQEVDDPLELPGFARPPITGSQRIMPGKAAKIRITERQQDILRTLRDAVTAPSHLRQRAALVLAAFDGARNEDIAGEIGLGRRQVGRWRRRWATAWADLIELECRESKADLRRAIEATLS